MGEEPEIECNLYTYNKTDPFHIGNTYGGLPTTLLTNAIGWTLLMVLFLLVRKSAFKYIQLGRREELTSDRNFLTRITRLFFSGNIIVPPEDNNGGPSVSLQDSGAAESTSTAQGGEDSALWEDGGGDHHWDGDKRNSLGNKEKMISALRLNATISVEDGQGFWKWLIKVFTLSDSALRILAGEDAVQYLRFQRYIIGYIFATTLLSICVILPLNFQGDLQGNSTEFGHTTLSNLPPDSVHLWVHITIAFLLFPIAIFTMRRFSSQLKFRDPGLEITRTLCIEKIPLQLCKEDILRRHFKEAYPRFELADCKIVYDVTTLTRLDKELEDVRSCYLYAFNYREENTKELTMYPYCASRWCCCLCAPCSSPVSVVEYYEEKMHELQGKVLKQKELALLAPLGMAFVTFKSVNDAKQVFEDHERTVLLRCNSQRPLSSISVSLQSNSWKVWFAPPPKDIYWEHLSDKRNWMFLKIVISNVFLFFVAFFLTTPEYAVSQFDTILIAMFGPEFDFGNTTGGSWIKDFIPTVLIWSFTALLPLLVAYSDRWLGRWTRSEENHSVMRKTFWYLLFMVVILPTFGFTTGKAYFNFLFMDGNSTEAYKWECIFLPDSGAFFVNYVITAALIGSGLELIRFPGMFWYMVQVCLSRTKAETPAIQRAVTGEFKFGEEYARMLMIFAMVMMYSLSCPLITPFGCLYFVLKHFADRHNLAFVYKPSKISKKVHASAINFVIMSVGLLQFFMVVFSIIRSGPNTFTARTKYALVLFVITINIFTAQIWSAFCRRLSPIKYEDVLYIEDDEDEHGYPYIPHVLKDVYPGKVELEDLASSTLASPSALGSPGYGTFVDTLVEIN